MRKNVGGQICGAQLVSATDGSAFTGTVTVYVTGDAGTQAIGSVGSGICTHEGNGFHTYAPAQAETNYNHVAFTFVGTGAVPVTVQIYTESIDRHDTVDLGLSNLDAAVSSRMATYTQPTGFLAATFPTAVSSQASVDTIDANVDAILADTNELQTDWTNGGRLDLILDARASQASVDTVDTNVDAVLADTNELQMDWVDGGRLDLILDARASQASVDTIDGIVDAILLDTAEIGAAGAGLTALASQASVDAVPTATENADELLKRDWTSVTGEAARSTLNALRFLRNKWSVSAGTLTVTEEDDTTTAWSAAITTDAAAEPVIGSDPT